MVRRVFFSFHFENDFWRTQQVRNINVLEGQPLCRANDWETVKRKGSASIEKWIDDNMIGKSCVVVLVGSHTAQRPWVIEEICKGWNTGKGVLGIQIHRLLNQDGQESKAGANPFDSIDKSTGEKLSAIVPFHSPLGSNSKEVYASIKDNIEDWIEEAIAIRKKY